MSDQKLNRRQFFERAAVIGAAVTGASAFLSGCKKSDGGGGASSSTKKKEPKADCSDLSGLSEQQKAQRKSLNYVDQTPKAEKNCANCKLFKKEGPCNKCTVVPGPIAAKGYCTAWQPMA